MLRGHPVLSAKGEDVGEGDAEDVRVVGKRAYAYPSYRRRAPEMIVKRRCPGTKGRVGGGRGMGPGGAPTGESGSRAWQRGRLGRERKACRASSFANELGKAQ